MVIMSTDAASLPCPICLHTGVFETVQSLKDRLIFVSTNNVLCPVCQDEVSGLDKLTIHLFSHVKCFTNKELTVKESNTDLSKINSKKPETVPTEQAKKSKKSVSKNKTSNVITAAPVKYVKIYPKLPVVAVNTMPVIDLSQGTDGCIQNNQLYISTVNTDTSNNTTNNKCNICGLQFVDANILNMHKNIVHNLDDTSNNTITRYECHLCPKNFKMRGSLMVHLRVAHFGFSANNSVENSKDNDKGDNDIDSLKVVDMVRQDGKQWQCDVCRKCFTTKYFLKKHKRLHTGFLHTYLSHIIKNARVYYKTCRGETPYACTQCNKTFTFQQSYHKHLLYHNDEKPHTCNYCGRSFKELSTLHNHQRIHTGEKPFACETCGKCFRQRVSYLVHRRIHTGAMPYKCTSCNKSFRYKVSQRTHKCQAQPPGTVVRRIGELVEKLKKKHTVDESTCTFNNIQYSQVSEASAELVRTGAKLSLEDMESDNFAIITEDINGHEGTHMNSTKQSLHDDNYIETLDDLIDSIPINDKSIPSPSEILKNLCLSNSEDDDKTYNVDGICWTDSTT